METDKLPFPSISELARELAEHKRYLRRNWLLPKEGEEGGDVRLNVQAAGWSLNTGDSQYDTDHRGYWGSGIVSWSTNCRALARDLIEQCRDHAAEDGHKC